MLQIDIWSKLLICVVKITKEWRPEHLLWHIHTCTNIYHYLTVPRRHLQCDRILQWWSVQVFLQVLTGKTWPRQPGQETGHLPTNDRPSPTPPPDAGGWARFWRYLTHFCKKKIFIFESEIFPLCIDFHKYRRHLPCIFFCPFPDILAMHKENPLVTAEMVNLQSTDIIGDVARYPLVKVHGKFQGNCNIQNLTVRNFKVRFFFLSLWNSISTKWMVFLSKRALWMSNNRW